MYNNSIYFLINLTLFIINYRRDLRDRKEVRKTKSNNISTILNIITYIIKL